MLKCAGPQRIGGFQSGISFCGLFLQLFSRGCSKNEKKTPQFFSGGYIDTVNRGFGQIHLRIARRSLFSGDDDNAQFGDYDSYGQIEEEANKFGFESNYEEEEGEQHVNVEEKPATSFSLADGFPEVGRRVQARVKLEPTKCQKEDFHNSMGSHTQ